MTSLLGANTYHVFNGCCAYGATFLLHVRRMLAYSDGMPLTQYVWIAYLLTALLLGGLCVVSVVQHRRVRRALMQQMLPKDPA